MREAGCRTRFTLPIVDIFRIAVRLTAEQARRERRAKRKGGS